MIFHVKFMFKPGLLLYSRAFRGSQYITDTVSASNLPKMEKTRYVFRT